MSKKTAKTRTEILMTTIGAFRGIPGNLTEQEFDLGAHILETEFDCDLAAAEEALARDLLSGMKAVAFAQSLMG